MALATQANGDRRRDGTDRKPCPSGRDSLVQQRQRGSSVAVTCALEWNAPDVPGDRTAELPVYTNGDRQEVLFYAAVPVEAAPETVVQRAVALRVA